MGGDFTRRVPVTFDDCARMEGPFFHGSASVLGADVELVPGHRSNFQEGRVSNTIYFSAKVETAAWGRSCHQLSPAARVGDTSTS